MDLLDRDMCPRYAMKRCTHLAKPHKDMDMSVSHVNGAYLDCIQCAGDVHAVGRLAFSQSWGNFMLIFVGKDY